MLNTVPNAEELIARLREQLPCTAEVTKHMPPVRDAEGNLLFRNKERIEIQKVIDGGHGGGVVCVTSQKCGKELVAISITHLRFDLSHPAYREIRAYQLHRIRVLKAEQLREQREKPLLPHQPRH